VWRVVEGEKAEKNYVESQVVAVVVVVVEWIEQRISDTLFIDKPSATVVFDSINNLNLPDKDDMARKISFFFFFPLIPFSSLREVAGRGEVQVLVTF